MHKKNGYQYSLITDFDNPDNIYFCTIRSPFFAVGSPSPTLPYPGVYISHNAGKHWEKMNKGIAQVGEVVNVEADPNDERYFWISVWGCGWYRGKYKSSL